MKRIVNHAKIDRRETPTDVALKELAKMPEDMKRMALAYAQGVQYGKRIETR